MELVRSWTGNETKAFRTATRMSQREFAAHLGISPRSIANWETGGASASPAPSSQEILDAALKLADADVRDRFTQLLRTSPENVETPEPSTPASSAGPDIPSQLIRADLQAVVVFTQALTQSMAANAALDYLQAEVQRLATDYLSTPAHDLFTELVQLRQMAFDMIERNRHPTQQRTLHLCAARICGLQAHVLLDTGNYHHAAALARAAGTYAEAAGHPNTHAWVLGIQSLITYWTGDLTAAARFAAAGTHLATSGATSIRLPSLQARAAAAAGNTTMAIAALATAEAHRHRTRDDPDALGGLFDFPESKRAVYTGTTLVTLGGPAHLARAIIESHRAISLYEASADPDVSQPDVLAARLDLATAHLAADELDASAEQTALVLAAPSSGHTASVRKRAASLAAALAGPNAPRTPLARDLAGQLADLATRGAPSADPEEEAVAT